MGNRWVAVLDGWLHEVAGLWGAGDYTFVQARLGLLHLGCNREVAALLRWLLAYSGFTVVIIPMSPVDRTQVLIIPMIIL